MISTLFEYQEDVDPTSLSFGDQAVGTATSLSVKRLNRLTAPFAIADVTVTGTNAADFDVPNKGWVGKPIAPGGGQEIEVTYQPHAVGPSSATLVITSGSDTREVPLSGTGIPAGNEGGGAEGGPSTSPPATTPPPPTSPPPAPTTPPPSDPSTRGGSTTAGGSPAPSSPNADPTNPPA